MIGKILNSGVSIVVVAVVMTASSAQADGVAAEPSATVAWGSIGIQGGASLTTGAQGVVQTTGQAGLGASAFNWVRNGYSPDGKPHNSFVDTNTAVMINSGETSTHDAVFGVSGHEQFIAAAHGGKPTGLVPFYGLYSTIDLNLMTAQPCGANFYSMILGPTAGLFYSLNRDLALYVGPAAAGGGKVYAHDGDPQIAGVGELGGVAGVFTKANALRAEVFKQYWTDGSAPWTGRVSYERVLNPSKINDQGVDAFEKHNQVFTVGAEAKVSQPTIGTPATQAQSTAYFRAAW